MKKGYMSWEDIGSGGAKNKDKLEFLWLKTGGNYVVRPIYRVFPFCKYFHRDPQNKLRTAICEDKDTCPVKAAHPELNEASLRYAILVIDRVEDSLKIMEGPKTVFYPLKERYEVTEKDPGSGKHGGNWNIKVTGQGKKTVYTTTFIEDAPITEEEKEMIKTATNNNKEILEVVYKHHSPEEIEKRLFGSLEDIESGSASSDRRAASVNEDVSEGNDEFDMNWDE